MIANPLIVSGLSLAGNTMVTSGLGFVFWVVAARLYTPAQVGVSAALIAQMVLLAELAHLGLRTGLVRYLPVTDRGRGRMIATSYLVAATVAAAAAGVFVAGLELWAPELASIAASPGLVIAFVAATAAWVVFLLEDSALIGLRAAIWVPVENGAFGALKLVLLVPLAGAGAAAGSGPMGDLGVFWAWTIPVFGVIVAVNVGVARILRATPAQPEGLGWDLAPMLRYSLSDWSASLVRNATIGLLPLIVLNEVGREQSAYYFLAWTIAQSIYLLSASVSDALLAEASHDATKVDRYTLQTGLLSLAISTPIVAVAMAASPLLLRAFGSSYASEALVPLWLLLAAAIPNAVVRTYVGRLRVEHRLRTLFALEAGLGLAILVSAWVMLRAVGGVGAAVAWTVVLTVAAVAVIVGGPLTIGRREPAETQTPAAAGPDQD